MFFSRSARHTFPISESAELAVLKPSIQRRQITQNHRACYIGCARAAQNQRDVAGKLAPECTNVSRAPGALGFHAAQRHDSELNFPGQGGDLLDRGVDAEDQRLPIGESEHQSGHLEPETMHFPRERCQSGDGPSGTIIQRLTHTPEEVAQDSRGEVLVPNFQLLCCPGIPHGPEKGCRAVLQELEWPEPSPVSLEPALEPFRIERAAPPRRLPASTSRKQGWRRSQLSAP